MLPRHDTGLIPRAVRNGVFDPQPKAQAFAAEGAGVCADDGQLANACAFGCGSNETSLPPARRIFQDDS